MSINLGGGGLSSAVQAFLERYGGNPDAEALDRVFGQHDHLAQDITGGFGNLVLTGPWWSENWDGTIPPDLASGADPAATQGFAIDPIAGALQALSFFGTSETTVGIGALWFTAVAPTGWLLLNGQTLNAVATPAYQPLYDEIGNTFGGSDNTDFQLPDLRGFFPFMQATSGTGSGAVGTTFGVIDHDHTPGSHTHGGSSISGGSHGHGDTFGTSGGSHGHGDTFGTSGGSHSHGDTFGMGSSSVNSVSTVAGSTLFARSTHSHSITGSVSTSSSHSHSVTGSVSTSSSHSHSVTGSVSTSSSHSHSAGNTGTPSASNTGTNNPPGFVLNFIIKF